MHINNLEFLIGEKNSLVWIETSEYIRCIKKIANLLEDKDKEIFILDFDNYIKDMEGDYVETDSEIVDFMNERENCILILQDYNEELKDTSKRKALIKFLGNEDSGNSIIIISPILNIPKEIRDYITVLSLDLPQIDDFKNIIEYKILESQKNGIKVELSEKEKEKIARAGLGLTEYEFKLALNLSLAKNNEILSEFILEQKKQLIEKNGFMKIYDSKKDFSNLIGLSNLKEFSKKMVLSGEGKGILILGVPGCGKTEFAKALGNETDRLTVTLDFADLMGAYVGQTEANTKEALRIVEAISPSILFIDEIEKGLSGVSSDGDCGVSKRQGGQFLKWLQDKSSDTYVIATANNIENLPSEFLRSGRWDGIFYIDIPSKETQQEILEFYRSKYEIPDSDSFFIDNAFYTGAEIETLCRLSKNLKVSLSEAEKFVCPIYKNIKKELTEMRKSVQNKFIMTDK